MNTQSILNKIKGENIQPRARWYFVVEHAALWIPGVVVTLIGAVAVAGELYALTHSGWEVKDFVYSSQTDFLLAMVPFVWIISFALFGSLIVKALRTTHAGYRLSVKAILLGSIGTSLVLGIFIYAMDEIFEADSVIRYPVQVREQQVWFSPKEGRLAGIIENKAADDIKIRDKDNTLWTVDMTGFGTTTFPFIEEGKSVRVIGTTTNEIDENENGDDAENQKRVFIACAVFPWEIGGFMHLSPASSTVIRHPGVRSLSNRIQNQNPDCKIVLDNIRQHVQGGERK